MVEVDSDFFVWLVVEEAGVELEVGVDGVVAVSLKMEGTGSVWVDLECITGLAFTFDAKETFGVGVSSTAFTFFLASM